MYGPFEIAQVLGINKFYIFTFKALVKMTL